MTPQLSLVIPVFNEAGNVTPLLERAVEVLAALGRPFEIVVVNDSSTDGTTDEIAAARTRWPQVTELRQPRRTGQARALLAGLRAARGEFLLTMDGDGQNDPRDFPALLALVESGGCDLACGWRVERHDSALRRALSRFANTVRRGIFFDGVHDSGCQLRVMRRAVAEALFPAIMMQSFVPAIAVAAGFRAREQPVAHYARQRGESKYPIGELLWLPVVATMWLRLRLWMKKLQAPVSKHQRNTNL